MPPHDFVERLLESCLRQLAFQPKGAGNVVSRIARFDLIQQPQTLLAVSKGLELEIAARNRFLAGRTRPPFQKQLEKLSLLRRERGQALRCITHSTLRITDRVS